MVKRLLILLMLLPMMAGAGELIAIISHTITSNDTTSGEVIADTAYSPSQDISGFRYIQFQSKVSKYGDFALKYTADTFHVEFQTSGDQETWITHEVDSVLVLGTTWSTLILDADDVVFGNWGRARFIYGTDGIVADQPDSIGNVRGAILKLYYMLK